MNRAHGLLVDRFMPRVTHVPGSYHEALKNWQIARSEAASGRPTKKDSRAIDRMREDWEWGREPPEAPDCLVKLIVMAKGVFCLDP